MNACPPVISRRAITTMSLPRALRSPSPRGPHKGQREMRISDYVDISFDASRTLLQPAGGQIMMDPATTEQLRTLPRVAEYRAVERNGQTWNEQVPLAESMTVCIRGRVFCATQSGALLRVIVDERGAWADDQPGVLLTFDDQGRVVGR